MHYPRMLAVYYADVCCHDLLAPWGAYLAQHLGVPAVCFSVTVLNDDDHVATLAGAGDRPNDVNARAMRSVSLRASRSLVIARAAPERDQVTRCASPHS